MSNRYYCGTSACLSALYRAERYQQIVELVDRDVAAKGQDSGPAQAKGEPQPEAAAPA